MGRWDPQEWSHVSGGDSKAIRDHITLPEKIENLHLHIGEGCCQRLQSCNQVVAPLGKRVVMSYIVLRPLFRCFESNILHVHRSLRLGEKNILQPSTYQVLIHRLFIHRSLHLESISLSRLYSVIGISSVVACTDIALFHIIHS